MSLRTSVTPSGRFVYGVHRPSFRVANLREGDHPAELGSLPDGTPLANTANFPPGDVNEDHADWIYEIPNPFPFRGTSYIARSWADEKAQDPAAIRLPPPPPVSFSKVVARWFEKGLVANEQTAEIFASLPDPVKIALATSSTDPEDLTRLADGCAEFVRDSATGRPAGLVYEPDRKGRPRPKTRNHLLFEALANNLHLPEDYKRAMVLRPGAQGSSEIVGEIVGPAAGTHAFEYLRRNSYIPWGHYAANMADDAARYRIDDLTGADITGMRHLYYQRTYTRLAERLGIAFHAERRSLSPEALEDLRRRIAHRLRDKSGPPQPFDSTLWGWNFGFDFSPSNYRLNASHQQIHQQYAMIPAAVTAEGSHGAGEEAPDSIEAFAGGDQVAQFAAEYQRQTGRPFFDAYLEAIRTNRRFDNREDRERRLSIYEDEHVMLFVPKAQTSQWEIQVMCLNPVGNILEADIETRRSIDRAILTAVRVLAALGARMLTTFEYSKRFSAADSDQRLLYVFLPRIPQSPGGFSENQMRWITGHYPEDFAAACRAVRAPDLAV